MNVTMARLVSTKYIPSSSTIVQGYKNGSTPLRKHKGSNGSFRVFDSPEYIFSFEIPENPGFIYKADLYRPIKNRLFEIGIKRLTKNMRLAIERIIKETGVPVLLDTNDLIISPILEGIRPIK